MPETVTYSQQDYEKDLQSIENVKEGTSRLDWSAFRRAMIHELVTRIDRYPKSSFGHYSVEQMKKAIKHPAKHGKILIDISREMMNIPIYKRIVEYFANMGLFNYNIDVYDINEEYLRKNDNIVKFRNSYSTVCSEFEKINIKHEMSKIMKTILVEDVFYGLIFENNSDFFILKLDPRFCRIEQIQDGIYNFAINMSTIDPLSISSFPDYFQQAYIDYYKELAPKKHWYVPPADKQICIKFDETVPYIRPFLIGLMEDLLDLDVYKKLKLQKARVDNYKALVFEIPIDEDTVDKPLLTDETLEAFAAMNRENLPEDVGMIYSPGEAQAVSFKDNANTTNNLSDAVNNLYDNAGISKEMFNGGSSGTAFKLSIENDAAYIYRVYRQVERYFNRFIKLKKYNKPHYKFAIRIQDSTVFTRQEYADALLKASQNGLPYKIDYAISLGKTPSKVMGSLFLENEVFCLQDKLIPLSTSYTMTGTEEGGRPTNESKGEDLSIEGEKTADTDANLNR